MCSNADDFKNRNLFSTAKLLKEGYRYHKIRKAFSKFYHRHSELILKYNIGLITLLQQGISEPIFYGDLVYKFKQIVGKSNFSDQFKKIVKGFIRVRKTFSKFYRRYYDLISKFQVGLKSLLRQGLSEPDFYGDLVYKLRKIVASNNFSAQFMKIISHYKKIGYNINVLQQTACLVVNPITVGNFAFLFNCKPVGRTSDSMRVPT